jgi:hypothetical protein
MAQFTGARRAVAEEKMHAALQTGLDQGERVLQATLAAQPVDQLAFAHRLKFGFGATDKEVLDQVLTMSTMGDSAHRWTIHPHARQQLAEGVGVPTQYVDRLVGGEHWQKELLADILTRSYEQRPVDQRHLLRSIPDAHGNLEVRGFLSDKFRRLDTRPILEAFVGAATAAGARPFRARTSDIRTSMQVVIPMLREPIEGEFVALGLEWSNSDYGSGAHLLRSFILRLLCTNGMTGDTAMRQVHLGARLGDEIAYSDETYRLDTAATVSATRDTVAQLLGEEKLGAVLDKISGAASAPGSFTSIAKQLTKEEAKRAAELYDSPDVENLPAGETKWRAANVLSWMAQAKDIPADRRSDLERLGGQLLAA